jgi:hypothetical protein
VRKLLAASSLGDDHRRTNHHPFFFQEPDCYDHFSPSLRNTDLCRPSLVEDVAALNCAVTDSIAVGPNSSVLRSVASGGHGTGIDCLDRGPALGSNCLFADNTANGNGIHGIGCQRNGCNFARNNANGNGSIVPGVSGLDCNGVGCLFDGNVSNLNASAGIATSDGTSAMIGNVLNGNSATSFGGATSLGHNLCNGLPARKFPTDP